MADYSEGCDGKDGEKIKLKNINFKNEKEI